MHCNWGLAWQLQERWDRAIEQFQIAISQKSDHAPSHINLGSAFAVKDVLMRHVMPCEKVFLLTIAVMMPNLIWDLHCLLSVNLKRDGIFTIPATFV